MTQICITLPQTKPQNDIKSFQDKKVEEPDGIYEYKTSEITDCSKHLDIFIELWFAKWEGLDKGAGAILSVQDTWSS